MMNQWILYEVVQRVVETDERITVLKDERYLGLNYSFNHCSEQASCEYIARMDDDCFIEGLEKQTTFLE